MNNPLLRFSYLPLEQLQTDPHQPRTGYATEGNRNQLKNSLKEIGIQTPLDVLETDKDTYRIIDGHRRYLCAKELGLTEVPCIIFDHLHEKQLDRIRYEIQNNRRAWRPLERATALESIRRTQKCHTLGDLAAYVHLSETTVERILLLKEQNITYLQLWAQYNLSESFQHALTRLLPKLRRVGDREIEEVLLCILEKIKAGVIVNSKELSSLGSVFIRFSQNEAALQEFLEIEAMSIRELARKTLLSGFSLHIEQVTEFIKDKSQRGLIFSPSEERGLKQLRDLLKEVLV